MTLPTLALGIDIGGTGIKAALVDTSAGELIGERIKVDTPAGGSPDDIIATTETLLDSVRGAAPEHLQHLVADAPIGVCFPAVVRDGTTLSAANVSEDWIGLPAADLFSRALDRRVGFVNDADAAGVAEARWGAAAGQRGLVILTTLGTGIGSALLYDGTLVPNSELGHLELHGRDAEHAAAFSAKERDDLSWEEWAERLQHYYAHLERLFTPALFLVGGGVSKHHELFLPLLRLGTPIRPAAHRNNAGILGAAWIADSATR